PICSSSLSLPTLSSLTSHRFFFLRFRPPPIPPLFPYTTLFRSVSLKRQGLDPLSPWGQGPPSGEGRLQRDLHHVAEGPFPVLRRDRKSTRLNSSHVKISYAVFCLKKKNKHDPAKILPVTRPLTE